MTRLVTDGFECGLAALCFTASSLTVLNTGARTGTYCLRLSKDNYGQITIAANAEIYLRVGLKVTNSEGYTLWPIIWRKGTTQLGHLAVNYITHKLELYTGTSTLVGTGSKVLIDETWYLIEMRIKIADSGNLEVKVDGFADITFAGDSKPGADTTIDNIYLYAAGSSSVIPYYTYFDDLAINDVNGGVDDTWIGDGHIVAVAPNANGDSSGLDGSDGNSVDNYLLVDDVTHDSDTTYVEESTADAYDLYNLATPTYLFSTITIGRIWIEAIAKNTVAGGQCKLGVKNTTESWSSAINTGTSYGRLKTDELKTDHDDPGNPWTTSDIASLQAGFKVV